MPDSKLDQARVLTGEQTNSAIVFPNWVLPGAPDGCLLKVLRYPGPELHPDVEVPQALHRVGFTQVPKFLGTLDMESNTLGILSQWIPDAQDGFELACEYARRGESFAGLARSLGETIARLHQALAQALPAHQSLDSDEFAAYLRQRAESALQEVPNLKALRPQIMTALSKPIDSASPLHSTQNDERGTGPQGTQNLALQRIHGDLHLGQLLYRPENNRKLAQGVWYVLDFEGEPLRPAEERRRPDLPERDLAGMVRSFDYAAAVGMPDGAGRDAGDAVAEGQKWAQEATLAFLAAYQQHRAIDQDLLSALVLDKALYEAVYEKRHRPDWLSIPIAAIEQILAEIR